MISTQDLRGKEVINIYDGKSIGLIDDIEVDLTKGTVEGIVIPAERKLFSFGRPDEQVIRWKDIKRIGDDVVLVDIPMGNNLHRPLDMVYNNENEES